MFSKWFHSLSYTQTGYLTSREGFTLKDLIKISHVQATDEERKIMIDYFLFGLKKAKERHGKSQHPALAYFEQLDKLKALAEKGEKSSASAIRLISGSYMPLCAIPTEAVNAEVSHVCSTTSIEAILRR